MFICLFVQLLLSRLALLLAALLRRHLLRDGWAGVSLVCSELGVDVGGLVNRLDGELLLAL